MLKKLVGKWLDIIENRVKEIDDLKKFNLDTITIKKNYLLKQT